MVFHIINTVIKYKINHKFASTSRFVLRHTVLQPEVIIAILLKLAVHNDSAAAAAPFRGVTEAALGSAENTRERCRNGSVNLPPF